MSESTKKTPIRDGLIILGITLVLFGILEGALRLIFPARAAADNSVAYMHHPDYLVTLRPNVEKTFVREGINGGDTIVWRSNSMGMRGPEPAANPPFRVVVYGDSNIQARFSTDENTYTGQLQRMLRDSIAGLEVINAGIIGAGPDQYFLRFQETVDQLQPDLVIFNVFTANDYGDLVKNRLFEVDSVSGALRRSRHPVTVDDQLADKPFPQNLADDLMIVRAVRKLLSGRSSSNDPEKVMETIAQLEADEYRVYRDDLPRSYSHFGDHYELGLATDPDSAPSRLRKQLMSGVLDAARNFSTERNIPFVVVVQPTVTDLTTNVELTYEHLEKYPAYRPENLTETMMDICRDENLACVDLFPIYQKLGASELFFKGTDKHWNDRGQEVAARSTVDYLNRYVFRADTVSVDQ